MNTYVFVTLNLCAMHGSNMYLYNKTNFLKEKGWRVFVFSAEQGKILIAGLREYQKYQIPALRFYPGCFSSKQIEKTLKRMTDVIGLISSGGNDRIIVESTNLISSLWGEILAERFNCKNLAYILQERFGYSNSEKDFLRFKLKRHELAGIVNNSVEKMLKENGLPFREDMRIRAFCSNTIDNCEDTISPRLNPNAQITIGSIGRLEKPYVIPFIKSLRQFIHTKQDVQFNLVMIGGTRAKKKYQQIKDLMKEEKNLSLLFTGYMFPIPQTFVQSCDLFISAAGSASATYYQKRPTIRLNPDNGNIVGITGLTYQMGDLDTFANTFPLSDLGKMIDLALEKRNEIIYTNSTQDGSYNRIMEEEFDKVIQFIELSKPGEYYNTLGIKYSDHAYKPFNILGRIISPSVMYRTLELVRKIVK